MQNRAFEIKGTFRMSERGWQSFTLQVAAAGEDSAREKALCLLGSRHRTPRRLVKIENVREIKGNEIEDPVVLYEAGGAG